MAEDSAATLPATIAIPAAVSEDSNAAFALSAAISDSMAATVAVSFAAIAASRVSCSSWACSTAIAAASAAAFASGLSSLIDYVLSNFLVSAYPITSNEMGIMGETVILQISLRSSRIPLTEVNIKEPALGKG